MQFAPAARLVPHVFANTNELALVPVTAMLVMVNAALPELVTVTDCDPLDAPTVVEGNVKELAERVTAAATPVPLNAMLCGEPLPV